ncbi:MAG: PDZ domain-containing protein [Candidatus Magnetomorum sp.]|nr:PDZ domain-containing protein [Candidatus Magnetomorum sp.]
MIYITAKNHYRSRHAENEIFDIKDLLFLTLLGLLIFWAFQGNQFEKSYEKSLLGLSQDNHFGAEVIYSGTGLTVQSVLANSPADIAGIKKNDHITGFDGQFISSLDMAKHIIKIAAEQEGTLKVNIQRGIQSKELYVNFNTRTQAMTSKRQSIPFPRQVIAIILMVKLTVIMFFMMIKNIVDRMYIVSGFAVLIIIVGNFFNLYSFLDAFFSIKFNTISLLLGMGIISIVLDEAGVFDYISYKMYGVTRGNRFRMMVLFCFITYIFSSLVNNLTTILVIVPMTLNLSQLFDFDPKPIIVGEIISSNIGGASTMVGDFPNMLISSEMNIPFNEFIVYMMPICIVLFGALLIYLKITAKDYFNSSDVSPVIHNKKLDKPIFSRRKTRAIRRSVFVLFHVILLFMLSSRISIRPSAIALFGGLSLFLFSGINRKAILNRVGFNDIFFFIGLFIVVGGIESSGLMHYISQWMTSLSVGKEWLLCLILMWSAALITSFLSAGPTTAIFFPIVLSLSVQPPEHIIWWTLSLGVLAGSSATIVGATAGPVSAGLIEKHCRITGTNLVGGNTIHYKEFAKTGYPVMLMFLVISSFYIVFLNLRTLN